MMRVWNMVSVVLVGSALAACGAGEGSGGQGSGSGTPGAGAQGGGGDPSAASGSEPVATPERDALVFAREEEKLARDVYGALAGQDPIFSNIQRSEQTHMDAVLALLDRYGIADPAANATAGRFTNQTLQALHDGLVAQGAASRLAALSVGVEIEELDLHDIEGMRATTTRNDVLATFDNLTRGSRNHLRSFYGQLTALGGTYTPRHLDAAAFQAIVASPMETGRPER